MFEDLMTELDRDRSSSFAQFGRAVLADLSADDLEEAGDADILKWMHTLYAALEADRTVVVSNDNGRHTSIIVVAPASATAPPSRPRRETAMAAYSSQQ